MADTDVTAQTTIDNSIARAKDVDKTQWTDAQLLKFLNIGYDYAHKILIRENSELVITDADITMTATQEFSLTTNLADFWGMAEYGVYFSGVAAPLTPVTYEDKIRAANGTTDTSPGSYYVTDTHIGLVDIPTATSIAAYPTLSCRYFKRNTPLTLTSNMPYKNLFNEPLSTFMSHVVILKTNNPTEEITALYNALEETTVEIAKKRVPV